MAALSSIYERLRRKDRPLAQVAKYVVCGGISVAVDQAIFYLLAWLVWPCLRATDPVARLIVAVGLPFDAATEAELARNYYGIKAICFLLSNAVVYVLNVLFVFESGRHRRPVEVVLFFGAALFQFFFIWLGRVLITTFGWEVTYSNVAMLVCGIVMNYFVRKFLVFKR